MEITASEVNKLRQKTGAGLMDCKKALVEAKGDFEAAIDFLRKKGQKVSELRAAREANEGAVIAMVNTNNKKGVAIYLNSETDFVAKNEEFIAFANEVANKALEVSPKNLDELLNLELNGTVIKDRLNEMVAKIGEKIDISKYEKVEGEQVVAYNHMGNKIGVLVAFNIASDKLAESGRDIAMQIAAMNPVAIDKDSIPQDVIDREIEIGKDQARQEGKPEDIIEKIAVGKLQKFYKENTLIGQQFVKDNSKTIADVLKSIDPNLKVINFKRVEIGN